MTSGAYDEAVRSMLFWRRAQAAVLFLLMAAVPILTLLSLDWALHLPIYAGALISYLICERKRTSYRNLAREFYSCRV